MSAPTLVQAGTGQVWTTGAAVTVSLAGVTVGNGIIMHVFADGASTTALSFGAISGIANLAGTGSSITAIPNTADGDNTYACGSPAAGQQLISIGRATATSCSIPLSNPTSGEDIYFRLYEFLNMSAGSALATVIENVNAGETLNGAATSITIADTTVTTLGVDRLALNFIGVNDDNQADFDTEAFTGQTGGTWVSGGSYGSATGTDGAIGLQTAAMAAAGTINGGTLTMLASDSWGVAGFALIGNTAVARDLFPGPTNFQDPGLFFKRWRPQRKWWRRPSGLIIPEQGLLVPGYAS